MGGIVVERAFATIYVIDYEKRKRRWIGISITLIIFTLSLFIASQIVQGGINGVFCAVVMVVPVFNSIIAFRLLLRRNQKRLASLNGVATRRFAQDKYTLRLRMQLRENIWTMKKLNRMASIASPVSLTCLPFLFLPPIFLTSEDSWWILEIIFAVNNTVLAAIAPFLAVMIFVIFEEVRRMLFPKGQRGNNQNFPRVIDVTLNSAIDQHFDQLCNIFNTPHEKRT